MLWWCDPTLSDQPIACFTDDVIPCYDDVIPECYATNMPYVRTSKTPAKWTTWGQEEELATRETWEQGLRTHPPRVRLQAAGKRLQQRLGTTKQQKIHKLVLEQQQLPFVFTFPQYYMENLSIEYPYCTITFGTIFISFTFLPITLSLIVSD